MKFGKLLKTTSEGMPEMHSLFLRYKELKKHIKGMKANPKPAADEPPPAAPPTVEQAAGEPTDGEAATVTGPSAPPHAGALSKEEQEFIKALNEDLSRFNDFFMSAEEDAVIKLQVLLDAVGAALGGPAGGNQEVLRGLMAQLVDFHGEMVLLLHWSLLNYAAVVKILKKHDKRTGWLLRAPYLANVLQQPFSSTTITSRLVKQAEQQIAALAPRLAPPAPEGAGGTSAPDPDVKQRVATGAAPAAPTCSSKEQPAQLPQQQQQQQQQQPAQQQQQPPAAPLPPPPPQQQQKETQQEGCAAGQPATAAAVPSPHPAAAGGEPGCSGATAPAAPAGGSEGGGLALEAGAVPAGALAGTSRLFARTTLALHTWDTLTSTAHTPSTLLPAAHSSELLRQLRLRQRWAALLARQAPGAGPPADAGGQQQQQQEQLSGESPRHASSGVGGASAADGSASFTAVGAAMDAGGQQPGRRPSPEQRATAAQEADHPGLGGKRSMQDQAAEPAAKRRGHD